MLPAVIEAVTEAGRMVAAEFCRPDGPRFADHVTAPVDHEIEIFLRSHLLDLLPARFVGEEAGVLEAPANGFCWVVDPHDGTRAYLEGRRGSSVSVALLRGETPVLGVVFAPLSPDRGPDLIAWAEGAPITRNGAAVAIDLRARGLAAGGVVFLNHGAWQRPLWHGTAVAPGRFMPLPSIAYRLARVAVGDGIATLTLRPVQALDIVAGHALLLAAGGVLEAEDGTPVTYDELGHSRPSACFGGAPAAVAALRARTWRGSTEPRREPRVTLAWPRAAEDTALDRAVGAMLGLLIADGAVPGADAAPDGRIGGQPGAVGEAALEFARALVAETQVLPLPLGEAGGERGAQGHGTVLWGTPPPDPLPQGEGENLASAGAPAPRPRKLSATAALARMVPLGIADAAPRAAAIAEALRTGADLVQCADLAAAIAAGLAGAGHDEVCRVAGAAARDPVVAGALLGAARGRRAFSPQAALAVLTCRPDAGLGVGRPRPDIDWPDDVVDLAEALLLCRRHKEPA